MPYINRQPIIREDYATNEGYRIASMVNVGTNRILMVFQNTRIPNISTDSQNSRLMVMDITLDPTTKALTLSAPRIIVSYRSIPAPSHAGETAFADCPTLVRIATGAHAGRLVLFFTTNKDNPDTGTPTKAYKTYSDDDGQTWATPVALPTFDAAAGGVGEGWSFAAGPPSIQLQYGANAGRIVIPAYVYTAGGYARFVCAYSDDGCDTFSFGNRAATYSNETAIAQDSDGTIYASARTDTFYRDLLQSTDGGVNWTMVSAGYLADSKCNSSLAAFNGGMFTVNAISSSIRGDLHLRFGTPSSFSIDYQVDSSYAGYSCVAAFNTSDVLLVYEDNLNYVDSTGAFYNVSTSETSLCALTFNLAGLATSAGPFQTNSYPLAAAPTYADYAARVVADGGVVVDPTACSDAFDFLTTNSIDTRQFVVGAKFGVKQAGGVVLKLYSFDGNDFIPSTATGDGPFYDPTGTFPVILVEGVSAAKYLRSIAQKPLLAAAATGMCLALAGKNDATADSLYLAFAAIQDGATNYPAMEIDGYNNDFAASRFDFIVADSGYNPVGSLSAAYQEIATIPSYADFAGVAGHLNVSTLTSSTYLDGVASGTKAVAPAVYNYASNAVRMTFSAAWVGTATPGIQRHERFAELWQVNNCSAAFALALSDRLGSLY